MILPKRKETKVFFCLFLGNCISIKVILQLLNEKWQVGWQLLLSRGGEGDNGVGSKRVGGEKFSDAPAKP